MKRFEIKYIIDNKIEKFNFLKYLFKNGFSEIHKARVNNTIYFDYSDLRFFHESEEGIADRTKIRLRYYGTQRKYDILKFILEIKKSNAYFKTKLKSSIGNFSKINKNSEVNFFLNEINVGKLKPVLKVNYKRKYFFSEKLGRITLDENIVYQKISWKNFLNTFNYHYSYNDSNSIVEHKIENHLKQIDNQFIPLIKTRHSKYCEGIKFLNIF